MNRIRRPFTVKERRGIPIILFPQRFERKRILAGTFCTNGKMNGALSPQLRVVPPLPGRTNSPDWIDRRSVVEYHTSTDTRFLHQPSHQCPSLLWQTITAWPNSIFRERLVLRQSDRLNAGSVRDTGSLICAG